jgi:hypothetical protein
VPRRKMPETDLYVGEEFGDNDVDPEDPVSPHFDEGNGEWGDWEDNVEERGE